MPTSAPSLALLMLTTLLRAQGNPAAAPAALAVLKVCGEKNPPPCATTPPRVNHSPEPKYSKEARKKKINGIVVLYIVVGTDGGVRDIRVTRSLGYGLDEEAIRAVRKWKFLPGADNGVPVPVEINVVVTFRLY